MMTDQAVYSNDKTTEIWHSTIRVYLFTPGYTYAHKISIIPNSGNSVFNEDTKVTGQNF